MSPCNRARIYRAIRLIEDHMRVVAGQGVQSEAEQKAEQ